MSSFKKKNIKFEKYQQLEKRSEHYNVIADEHNKIVTTFKMRQNSLPDLKQKVRMIDEEIEKLNNDDEVEGIVESLTEQKILLEESMKHVKDGNINQVKITKKKKKAVFDENITEEEKIMRRLTENYNKISNKLEILSSTTSRKSYIRSLNEEKNDLLSQIYDIENKVDELDYYDQAIDLLEEYNKKPSNNDKQVIDVDYKTFFLEKPLPIETNNKKHIIDKYLQTINKQKKFKKVNIGKICTSCNIVKLFNPSESTFICPQCAETELVIMDPEKPSYKDPINEPKQNTYRRINHCSELLNQSQGKELTEIEEELLKEIVDELKVLGITDLSKVTPSNIKQVLKNIGKSIKSEHAVYIANKLNKIPLNTLPHDTVNIVKTMFTAAEETWKIFKPPGRKNFMNCNYIFHKIFELLGDEEQAEKWPLLKYDKLAEHDEMWEKICNHLKWEFIPSI